MAQSKLVADVDNDDVVKKHSSDNEDDEFFDCDEDDEVRKIASRGMFKPKE
jgi:hypothetical protein